MPLVSGHRLFNGCPHLLDAVKWGPWQPGTPNLSCLSCPAWLQRQACLALTLAPQPPPISLAAVLTPTILCLARPAERLFSRQFRYSAAPTPPYKILKMQDNLFPLTGDAGRMICGPGELLLSTDRHYSMPSGGLTRAGSLALGTRPGVACTCSLFCWRRTILPA